MFSNLEHKQIDLNIEKHNNDLRFDMHNYIWCPRNEWPDC